ncbi:MAG: hypothetical protein KOO60_14395 [Gemmatimonadales bacterium]|nr:hypothetical protein [Gemmatimonadales bacterium]
MCRAIIILCLICAADTFADPIDPVPDHVGVYFDTEATVTSLDSAPGIPFNAYVILTNPTADGIWGYEVGYRFVVPAGYEDSYTRLESSTPYQSIDLGNSEDISQGDYIVGIASPIPRSDAVVLVTWEFEFAADFPMDIYLGPASRQLIEDGWPAYVPSDSLAFAGIDSVLAVGLPSGDVNVLVATVNGCVSGVPVQGVPNPVVLERSQPNPFNPRTMIKYSMAQAGRVTLVVHDLSGEVVKMLINAELVEPGEHEVFWNGTDKAGRAVASGVYLYRIDALGKSETKKMTLVQ